MTNCKAEPNVGYPHIWNGPKVKHNNEAHYRCAACKALLITKPKLRVLIDYSDAYSFHMFVMKGLS